MSEQEKYELLLERVTPESLAKFLFGNLGATRCVPSVFTRSKYLIALSLDIVIRISDHPYPSDPNFSGMNIFILPHNKGVQINGEMLPIPKKLSSHIKVMHSIRKIIIAKYPELIRKPKPRKKRNLR